MRLNFEFESLLGICMFLVFMLHVPLIFDKNRLFSIWTDKFNIDYCIYSAKYYQLLDGDQDCRLYSEFGKQYGH